MTNLFLNRIFRAIKIDIELFEEVEKEIMSIIDSNRELKEVFDKEGILLEGMDETEPEKV